MAAFFIVTTVICVLGWISRYISCMSLIYYIKKKGYALPSDEEIKACTKYVVKHLLK